MILRLHILRGKLDKVNGFICSHLLRERSYRLQGQIPPSSVAKQGVQGVGIVSHITQNKQNMAVNQNQWAAWMVCIGGTLWTKWKRHQQWYLTLEV